MEQLMVRPLLFGALIATAICTGAGWYEQAVLDTAWPQRPSIVRPIEGGANRKLFWVPANLLAILGLLGGLWASWPAAAARSCVFVAIGLFAIVNVVTVVYFAPRVLRVERDSIAPNDPSSLTWVKWSRFRTPLSVGVNIALSLAISRLP